MSDHDVEQCVEPGCSERVPDGAGGIYRRARAQGWARVYCVRGVPDGFRCPTHRRQSHQTGPVPHQE